MTSQWDQSKKNVSALTVEWDFFPWCAGLCGNKSYLRCSSNTETFRFSFLLLRHGPPSDRLDFTYIFTKYFVWRTVVITHSLKDFLKRKKHSLKSAFSHSNNRSVNKTSSVMDHLDYWQTKKCFLTRTYLCHPLAGIFFEQRQNGNLLER